MWATASSCLLPGPIKKRERREWKRNSKRPGNMVVGGNNNIFIFNKARGSLYYAKNMVMASNITFRKGFVIPVFRSFWDLLPCRNILSHTLINKKDIPHLYLIQSVIINFCISDRIFVYEIFFCHDHLVIISFFHKLNQSQSTA